MVRMEFDLVDLKTIEMVARILEPVEMMAVLEMVAAQISH